MDRGARSHLLTWMLLPVSAVLVVSALSLPRQPYTGMLVRGDWVAAVDPGSPAAFAGIARGDRILPLAPAVAGHLPESPLARATPGVPLTVLRERGRELHEVLLIPRPLPDGERRMMGMLLAVASGFLILGGWVWSERRDPLTRTFFLLSLAFAWLLAPLPRWSVARAGEIYEALYSGVTLILPALFIHFFALFPESGRLRGRLGSLTAIAYTIAGVLFAVSTGMTLQSLVTGTAATTAAALLQGIAGLWFAAGLLTALALFVRSYRGAHTDDARRRMRVALVGTTLGVVPLAALVALHNLFPGAPIAGERWVLILALLVPASFAWATVVHRIFEFRVALRASVVIAVLALAGGIAYLIGEWLAASWRRDLGGGIAGGALAFLALTAAVAGPAGVWLRTLGARFVPERDVSLAEWQMRHPAGRRGSAPEILSAACEALSARFKLDGCVAVALEPAGPRPMARAGTLAMPDVDASLSTALASLHEATSLDDLLLAPEERAEFESAGVGWIIPIGEGATRVALLLGRRLAGAWLGRLEARELEAFADHLGLLLENATLRESATAHGAMDRDMVKAGVIQAHLLPRRIPAFRSLDCAAAAMSSEAVGGDYYDFMRGPGRVLTLAVGDAAGKGVPAALMRVWAQASFRNLARQNAGPGEMLGALNRELVSFDQPDAFVALLCARVEVGSGRLWFCNAGLTPPMLRRRDGTCEELTDGGVLLGVTPHARYEATWVELDAGDIMVLYTDGLTEARRGDEMFGPERVREVLDAHAKDRASDIVAALIGAVQAFTDHPVDDITVLVLKQLTRPVRERTEAPKKMLKWEEVAADPLG
jgi:serine phosphatase RsbU (regulator of sigma subunit)